MDIEHLNRTQILLLTLLVSFMSSVVTGIVTVRLLDQAPGPVTRTINQVVEHTVERLIPAEPGKSDTKETTVVVREEDLITGAIDKNAKSLVRIYSVAEGTASTTDVSKSGTFRGIGVVVSSDGIIAVPDQVAVKGRTYIVETGNGVKTSATILVEGRGDVALLKMQLATSTPSLSVASLGNASSLKLGQTVIALGGDERTNVGVGIVSAVTPGKETGTIDSIDASVSGTPASGSPLVTVAGDVVGLYITESKLFAPLSGSIVAALKTAPPKKTSEADPKTSTAAAANAVTPQ